MKNKAEQAIGRYNMLQRFDRVTVGVSGGADSMALLHFLRFESGLELDITVCHINHLLRADESDADERFVESVCKDLGLEFKLLRCDVLERSRQEGSSVEETARRVRYDFFRSCAGGGKIATAHTLSDAAETLIFNLTRGSSAAGLRSIPPVRGNIIRPLIFVSRSMIEKYCCEHKIKFVTDSSNLTDDYSRNKIRHNVIPVLKEINPAFEQAALRLMLSVGEDEEYLGKMADEAVLKAGLFETGENTQAASVIKLPLRLRVEALKNLPPPVLSRAAAKILESVKLARTNDNVTGLCGLITEGKDRLCLSGETFAAVRGKRLFIEKNAAAGYFEYTLCLAENDVIITDCDGNAAANGVALLPDGRTITARILHKNDKTRLNNIHKKDLFLLLDCDRILGKIIIRQKINGDRIKFSGMTKTLKKLFNEKKLSAYEKSVCPVCADEEGVLGAPGFGVCARAGAAISSEKILEISVLNATEKQNGK